ncbi:MAG: hypothetical protein H0V63_05450 [Burkholderiaceae bacterium]|nr:hypothetical protein [Burkholderiaceae bacterium]
MKRLMAVFLMGATVSSIGAAAAQTRGTLNASTVQARAAEDAPPEAVSRYMVGTRLGYITCSNKYRDYVGKWERFAFANEGQSTVTGSPPSDEDYRECVQETLAKGRGMYSGAAKQVTTASSRAALKDYQTAWESSLTTLGRTGGAGGEKPLEYRSRQAKMQARLDEMQRKVEAQAK